MKKHILISFFLVITALYSKAHVQLLYPGGGETFHAGDTVIIEWKELVSHNTLNWDLYFSSDGGLNWEDLQIDIPYDSLRYLWIVPYTQTTQGKIRIVQDNVDTDYNGVSDNFTISSITGINTPFEVNEVNVYPNPFSYFTTIIFSCSEGQSYTLCITDLSGKICRMENDIIESYYTLEKGKLKEGVYFIELLGPSIYRKKIIIQ